MLVVAIAFTKPASLGLLVLILGFVISDHMILLPSREGAEN